MVSRERAPLVKVTLEMKEKAMAFAHKVINDTYNRFQYDKKTRKNKIYLGKLGEEVLLLFFSKHKLTSKIDYKLYKGTSSTDETDLIINGIKIDLKVGSQPFHKRLLVVKSYFDNDHKSDFYVAINFYDNESIAVIYGFATKEDIQNAPIGKWDKINPVEDYTLLYEELKPIEELIKILKQY